MEMEEVSSAQLTEGAIAKGNLDTAVEHLSSLEISMAHVIPIICLIAYPLNIVKFNNLN